MDGVELESVAWRFMRVKKLLLNTCRERERHVRESLSTSELLQVLLCLEFHSVCLALNCQTANGTCSKRMERNLRNPLRLTCSWQMKIHHHKPVGIEEKDDQRVTQAFSLQRFVSQSPKLKSTTQSSNDVLGRSRYPLL